MNNGEPIQPGAAPAPQLKLQVLSNPLFLSGVRELVYQLAVRLGFPDEACGQLSLAVDEAICNVIRHGYQRAHDRPIWISFFADGGVADPEHPAVSPTSALRIVIEDEAKQVDLASIRSRNLEEIRPGGLGVHIIKEVMDEVRYEHRHPAGMRLTMLKRRLPDAPLSPHTPSPGRLSSAGGTP